MKKTWNGGERKRSWLIWGWLEAMRKTTNNVTDGQPSVLQLGHFKYKGDPLSATYTKFLKFNKLKLITKSN